MGHRGDQGRSRPSSRMRAAIWRGRSRPASPGTASLVASASRRRWAVRSLMWRASASSARVAGRPAKAPSSLYGATRAIAVARSSSLRVTVPPVAATVPPARPRTGSETSSRWPPTIKVSPSRRRRGRSSGSPLSAVPLRLSRSVAISTPPRFSISRWFQETASSSIRIWASGLRPTTVRSPESATERGSVPLPLIQIRAPMPRA